MLNGFWKNMIGVSDEVEDNGLYWSTTDNILFITDWKEVFGIPPLRESIKRKQKHKDYLLKTFQKLVSILLRMIKTHKKSVHDLNRIHIQINPRDFEYYKDFFKDMEALCNALKITPIHESENSPKSGSHAQDQRRENSSRSSRSSATGTERYASKQIESQLLLRKQEIEDWVIRHELSQETHESILQAETHPNTIASASVIQDLIKQRLLQEDFDTSKQYTWEK